ncbi:MAG: T9SS type B sorting domain-containing protein, partial [Flavobacteriales bacterium]
NEFIAYEVTSLGVNTTPVISALGGTTQGNFFGAMKISPNGKKIAVSNVADSRLAICDFNPVTGKVSNFMNLQIVAYGLEFSPNSKLLYAADIAENKALTQFNLEYNNETDIYNSRVVIAHAKANQNFGALQLGPDGKIYISKWNLDHIDVINSPNRLGLSCNYQLEAIYLEGKISKNGLPPFIQSYFNRTISFEDICFGSATMFELSDTVDSAVWDFGDPTSGINNTSTDLEPTHVFSAPGVYEVTVISSDDIQTTSNTTTVTIYDQHIVALPPDFLNDITVVDSSNNNSITINITNLESGDYEFALDNQFSFYQDEPYFENVKAGIHTFYIRDRNDCDIRFIDISVIGYPKYFTPNGDGINDYWHVEGVNGQFHTNSDIFIYDRYGKLLKQLAITSNGWDCTFNGSMMPTDDYWFHVKLEDGRQFKGHFTLKR